MPRGSVGPTALAATTRRWYLCLRKRIRQSYFPLQTQLSCVSGCSNKVLHLTSISKLDFLLQATGFCYEAIVSVSLPQCQQHPCRKHLGRGDAVGKKSSVGWRWDNGEFLTSQGDWG